MGSRCIVCGAPFRRVCDTDGVPLLVERNPRGPLVVIAWTATARYVGAYDPREDANADRLALHEHQEAA